MRKISKTLFISPFLGVIVGSVSLWLGAQWLGEGLQVIFFPGMIGPPLLLWSVLFSLYTRTRSVSAHQFLRKAIALGLFLSGFVFPYFADEILQPSRSYDFITSRAKEESRLTKQIDFQIFKPADRRAVNYGVGASTAGNLYGGVVDNPYVVKSNGDSYQEFDQVISVSTNVSDAMNIAQQGGKITEPPPCNPWPPNAQRACEPLSFMTKNGTKVYRTSISIESMLTVSKNGESITTEKVSSILYLAEREGTVFQIGYDSPQVVPSELEGVDPSIAKERADEEVRSLLDSLVPMNKTELETFWAQHRQEGGQRISQEVRQSVGLLIKIFLFGPFGLGQ